MWTEEHRRTYRREGEGYPSDLRDAEWARLEPLIPGATPGGQRRKTDMRAAMRRRDFYSTFAFGAILTPLAARAQQKAMPVVGVLSGGFPGSTAISPLSVAAFRQGLSDAGYIEEQNVAIEYRWAGNR